MTKTTFATEADRQEAAGTWYLVDASEHVLGRMAVRIAEVLMGKNRPLYTPHMPVGAGVVVINAAKAQVTGNKREGRIYRRYTGYTNGLHERSLGEYLERNPEELVKLAVRRMLPKTKLGKHMLSRLKVYSGAEHQHAAQQPQPLKISPLE
ncbi:MAG: 50S ribosomal protein L13 [Planctomycetota bacterium]